MCDPLNEFCYKEDILYHKSDQIKFEGIEFKAHIFYNEKAAIDYKHFLYKALLEIEKEFKPFAVSPKNWTSK